MNMNDFTTACGDHAGNPEFDRKYAKRLRVSHRCHHQRTKKPKKNRESTPAHFKMSGPTKAPLILVFSVRIFLAARDNAQLVPLGAVAGTGCRGLSDRLTLTRWRNAIFRVARATN